MEDILPLTPTTYFKNTIHILFFVFYAFVNGLFKTEIKLWLLNFKFLASKSKPVKSCTGVYF